MQTKVTKQALAVVVTVILLLNIVQFGVPLCRGQSNSKMNVVLLKDGVFDSADVLMAIGNYAKSVKASLGIDCIVVKISPEDNSPQGIDLFITKQFFSTNTNIFILVGNNLKFPLSIWDEGKVAMPADGVLSDTDGEISIVGDGLHQPISFFNAEVTISYVFPPKLNLSIQQQLNYVISAFNKFALYHNGQLAYSQNAIICGHFTDELFKSPLALMGTISGNLYGQENVIIKEMTKLQAIGYMALSPSFFGIAGHGSPGVVETNSFGETITNYDLATAPNGPLIYEIYGCWTNGWYYAESTDPWGSIMGYLTEAGIFENKQTIAMVTGFPESSPENGFATRVLRAAISHQDQSLGELMIGKVRRSCDWVLYGDPMIKIGPTITAPILNEPPQAIISSISPNPAEKGTRVYFSGKGFDSDGYITDYRWSLGNAKTETVLTNSASFSYTGLPVGTNYVYFMVRDDAGDWSSAAQSIVTITSGPTITIAAPTNGATVKGTQVISTQIVGQNPSFVGFYIDGAFRGYDDTSPYSFSWDSISVANGQHKILAKASLSYPPQTISSEEITVTVDNAVPTVTIDAPKSASKVNGLISVTASVTQTEQLGLSKFYIDGICKAYDYSLPIQWNWDTKLYPDGAHSIKVEAYYVNLQRYISSDEITVTVDNGQANIYKVTLSTTADIQNAKGKVTFNVAAIGPDLRYVYFYVDGAWAGYTDKYTDQFVWNAAVYSNGTHEIYALGIFTQYPPYVQLKSQSILVNVNK